MQRSGQKVSCQQEVEHKENVDEWVYSVSPRHMPSVQLSNVVLVVQKMRTLSGYAIFGNAKQVIDGAPKQFVHGYELIAVRTLANTPLPTRNG